MAVVRRRLVSSRRPRNLDLKRRSLSMESLEVRTLLHGGAVEVPITSGLTLRLAGDELVTTVGETVTGWGDASGTGNDLSILQGTPTVLHGALNGHDVIQLDGTDLLGRTGFTGLPVGNADRTVFMVANYHGKKLNGFHYGSPLNNEVFGVQTASSGVLTVDGWITENEFKSDRMVSGFGWLTQSVVLQDDQFTHYANGNVIDTQTHVFDTTSDRIRVGGLLSNGSATDFEVAEILVYNRALTSGEREVVEDYLQETYFPQRAGFRDEPVIAANQPIAIDFLPDGRMLTVSKAGRIDISDLSQTPATKDPYLVITTQVNGGSERGLIDIALDPDFSTNGYLYAYYAHQASGKFRISRFTHQGDTADPASELVIWEAPAQWTSCCHYGGGLTFGADGKLFLSIGDEFDAPTAQDLTNPKGSVIRINTDGSIPSDNPFVDGPGGNADEIYAYGLRNPFRAFYDAPTDRLLVTEVGGNDQNLAMEDINVIQAGDNFGWPACEGACADNQYADPIFSYPHAGSGASVIGGFVYRGGDFPPSYEGSYFYGDYVRGWIRFLSFDSNLQVIEDQGFSLQADAVVDLAQGPDGALYYVSIFGEVRRIGYYGENRPPTITQASADPAIGPAPLSVSFQGEAISKTATVEYRWDFGDGSESTEQNPVHEYTSNGQYVARLFATDANGTSVSEPIPVIVGSPPTAQILTPSNGLLFRAGEVITFTGTGSDADETLTEDQFSWDLQFLHNEHTHPGLSDLLGTSGSYTIPNMGHDYTDNTGYRLTLTVTDSDGLTATDSIEIFPEKVDITVDTVPAGIPITIDGLPRATPLVLDTVIDFQHELIAPSNTCRAGNRYEFQGWSVSGDERIVYQVPTTDASVIATYVQTGTCNVPVTDGLVLHLDADSQVVADASGIVSSWSDQSIAGNHLTPVGGSPLLVPNSLNGHNVVRFDGIDDALGLSNPKQLPIGNADRTVILVASYESDGWGGLNYGDTLNNKAFGPAVAGNGAPLGRLTAEGWGLSNTFVSDVIGEDAGWLVQMLVLNNDTLYHYANGELIGQYDHVYNTGASRLRLATQLNDGDNVDMDTTLALIYDRAITDEERWLLGDYFESSYGIEMYDPPQPPAIDMGGADIAARLGSKWWVGTSTGNSFDTAPWQDWPYDAGWEDVMVADVDGDDRDDIVGRNNGQWWVARSQGDQFVVEPWTEWSTAVTWKFVHTADVNGDGKDDLVGSTNGNWWVGISDGTQFTNIRWGRWSNRPDWVDVQSADVNGDGKADIVGRVAGAWWVAKSTGSEFINEQFGGWSTNLQWLDVKVGDFNGDGKDDIAGRGNGNWWLAVSNGTAFTNQRWAVWGNQTSWNDVNVGDFNNDGLDDIIARAANDGTWRVGRSTGTAFVSEAWGQWSTGINWSHVNIADVDNNGFDDVLGSTNGRWWVGLSDGAQLTNYRWAVWDSASNWQNVLVGNFGGVAPAQSARSVDFDQDGAVDARDLDLLSKSIRLGSRDDRFDLDGDGFVNRSDADLYVSVVLGTVPGDANLDGVFDSSDFVKVFLRGEYEDEIAGNSTWESGDWNFDGEFDSSDFVTAFRYYNPLEFPEVDQMDGHDQDAVDELLSGSLDELLEGAL